MSSSWMRVWRNLFGWQVQTGYLLAIAWLFSYNSKEVPGKSI